MGGGNKTSSWDALFADLDRHIKEGRSAEAGRKLQSILKGRVPREARAPLATLARRAGQPYVALRLLNPIVRPHRKVLISPTDIELAEYAASLSRIGAVDEALQLLEPLDGAKRPEVLAYRSLALVSQWRYAETIPLLSDYVKAPELTEYQRAVGRINLASALTYERRFAESAPVIETLVAMSAEQRFPLLGGKILEVAAEDALARRDWKQADVLFDRAEAVLKTSDSLDRLFARKWKAVMCLFREGEKEGRAAMEQVRSEAEQRKHWETLRELDRFTCLAHNDEALLWKVYFGTPFEGYRRRLLSDFGYGGELPDTYEWNARSSERDPVHIDLSRAEASWRGKTLRLKSASVSHRLLSILASDSYRPFRQASVHAALYPGEYFNPESSPFRVREAMHRLRSWLERNRLPVGVLASSGFVHLRFEHSTVLRLSRQSGRVGAPAAVPLLRLAEKWSDEPFTLPEASRLLGTSERSTLRILESGRQDGRLERTGKARATRYRFVTRKVA